MYLKTRDVWHYRIDVIIQCMKNTEISAYIKQVFYNHKNHTMTIEFQDFTSYIVFDHARQVAYFCQDNQSRHDNKSQLIFIASDWKAEMEMTNEIYDYLLKEHKLTTFATN